MISAYSPMESLGQDEEEERKKGDKSEVRTEWRAGLEENDKEVVNE